MMRLSRTTLAVAGLISATAIALTGCSAETSPENPTNPTQEQGWTAPSGLTGEITLYAANPQALNEELAAKFTELSGVKVNIFGGETGKLTAKLDAEWENPQADVVYLASWAPAAKYAEADRALSYKPSTITGLNAGWAGPNDTFHGRDGSALTLVVNTTLAPSTPTDWADLAKPEWKDKIVMPDPRESGTARDLIAAMVQSLGEDATWALFDSLFANGLVVNGANGPALDSVVSGSYAAVFGGVDYSAYSAIKKGEPLEVVLPTSGTTVSPRPVFILKESKNVEAAKAFVDFLFSAEAQKISASKNMIPAIAGVPAAEGLKTFTEVPQLKFDFEFVAANGKDILANFVEKYLP